MTPEQLRLSCAAIEATGHELSSAAKRALRDTEDTSMNPPLGPVQQLVADLLAANPALTSAEIAAELNRPERQISEILNTLESLGAIDEANQPTLADALLMLGREADKYEPSMSLYVSDDGKFVELCIDPTVSTYADWIPGEGGDICLTRCRETKRVVGCCLPLLNRKLSVWHDGPLRINEGFKKAAPAERGSG